MQRCKIIWIALGIGTLLMRVLLSPAAIERFYSRSFFLGVRIFIDYGLAWSPVALLYMFVPALMLYFGSKAWRWARTSQPWRQKASRALLAILAFFSGTVFWFLMLWGFNYGRVPLEQQLDLNPTPLTLAELREELEAETSALIELRQRILGISDSAFTADLLPADLENHMRAALTTQLQRYGFPITGRVRGRIVYPKGIFLRFSSAGLYFPWTGEGHIDAGLHPVQIPYVIAHEMAHGYGFGDEGDCNFWAYLACIYSEHPAVAYAGRLDYWRSLAADYARYDREDFRRQRAALPSGIEADLRAIRNTLDKYPDIMPRLRYVAYDTYLRTQGIQEGILNYDRVTMLVRAWRKANRREH